MSSWTPLAPTPNRALTNLPKKLEALILSSTIDFFFQETKDVFFNAATTQGLTDCEEKHFKGGSILKLQIQSFNSLNLGEIWLAKDGKGAFKMNEKVFPYLAVKDRVFTWQR